MVKNGKNKNCRKINNNNCQKLSITVTIGPNCKKNGQEQLKREKERKNTIKSQIMLNFDETEKLKL